MVIVFTVATLAIYLLLATVVFLFGERGLILLLTGGSFNI